MCGELCWLDCAIFQVNVVKAEVVPCVLFSVKAALRSYICKKLLCFLKDLRYTVRRFIDLPSLTKTFNIPEQNRNCGRTELEISWVRLKGRFLDGKANLFVGNEFVPRGRQACKKHSFTFAINLLSVSLEQ